MVELQSIKTQRWGFLARNVAKGMSSTLAQYTYKLSKAELNLSEANTPLEKWQAEGQIESISWWKEQIESGRSNASLVLHYSKYLMVLDYENAKMWMHMKYVAQENMWLRKEMYDLHRLLVILERRFVAAEAEKKFFQYYYNMRNYTRESAKKYAVKLKTDLDPEEEDSEPEEDVPQNLSALFHVVAQFISENKFLVASSWCNKSVIDFKRVYGEGSREVGAVYNLLGRVYKHSEAFQLAKEYFELALTIREKVDGRDSDQVGVTLSLLGSTLGSLGLYKKAHDSIKRALAIREKIYGRNNEVAHLYKKMAEFSFALKLWPESISNYKVCLAIFEGIYDATDWTVMKSLTTLAHAYLETKVPSKAFECLAKVNLAYIRKNNPGSFKTSSPITVIEDFIKRSVGKFPPEMLLQRFGTVSSTLNDNVVEVMILYYDQIEKPEVSDMLRGWLDLSIKNMNSSDDAVVTQAQAKRRLSMSSMKMTPELGRKESGASSVKESIKKIFRGKK